MFWWLLRIVGWLASLAFIGLIIVTAWWLQHGGRIYSVETASMSPTLKPGDAVLVSPRVKQNIGDIISFHDRKTLSVITHRIVDIDNVRNRVATKGDSNARLDDQKVTRTDILGTAIYQAPYLGAVLSWLRHPLGLIISIYIPVVILLMISSYMLAKPTRYYRFSGR